MKLVRIVPLLPGAWKEILTRRVLYLGPPANRAQRVCVDVLLWDVTMGWIWTLPDLVAASDSQKHPRKSLVN